MLEDSSNSAIDPTLVEIEQLVERAKTAQAKYEAQAQSKGQSHYDMACKATAWALMKPAHNKLLSEMAVETTSLGNVTDKICKNHRKTLGLLRDLEGAQTTGVIDENPELGLTEIARPIGVICAVVPSTNPVATPTNKTINALKSGNAIILSPSPKGEKVCAQLIEYIHAEFKKSNLDPDLVQMVPPPTSKAKIKYLMELVDLVIVTGSQANVRAAYSSGTPAIGVGAGNVSVIVDETADLDEAAQKIIASKTFDNATSCSSENNIIVVDAVFDDFVSAMQKHGSETLTNSEKQHLCDHMWQNGKLNRAILAQDITVLLDVLRFDRLPPSTRCLLVPEQDIGKDFPLSGEKMSLVASLYRAKDFSDAKNIAQRILAYQGAGHSIGLHSQNISGDIVQNRALQLGLELQSCRVIVNQAHCFATGGSFDNGLPFSLSMGCGSWGENSISDNMNYRHFMNITRIIRPIPPREPSLDAIFGSYWDEVGQ